MADIKIANDRAPDCSSLEALIASVTRECKTDDERCGGEHTVLAAWWEKAGYKWRYRGWSNPGHTTVECYYGGRWHYLDTFLRFYAWMPDPSAPGGRTIAGQEDIKANPALVTDGFVAENRLVVSYAY